MITETCSTDILCSADILYRYFCSRCDSLQDATRYTELRCLPPVLHFSLLRFVYDVNTMERKKSKHSISFPTILDMRKFMGSKNDRGKPQDQLGDDDIYELRGILLHKGASAYHGHYEAQVNDVESVTDQSSNLWMLLMSFHRTGSWFQFNDDVVTKIGTLGDKNPSKKTTDANVEIEDEVDEKFGNRLVARINTDNVKLSPNPSQLRKIRSNARKRRRVEDSDDEVIE